jgi:hypothetical protein
MTCAGAPVAPDDPARREASAEVTALRDRYRIAARNIEVLQRRLESRINDPIHRLLRDIPEGWNRHVDPELLRETDWTNTAREVRAEATRMVPLVIEVEDLHSRLSAAVDAKERATPETLIWALFGRLEETQRLIAQRFGAVEDRLDTIEQQSTRIAKTAKYLRGQRQKAAKHRSSK